jgi:hypothetical protein
MLAILIKLITSTEQNISWETNNLSFVIEPEGSIPTNAIFPFF